MDNVGPCPTSVKRHDVAPVRGDCAPPVGAFTVSAGARSALPCLKSNISDKNLTGRALGDERTRQGRVRKKLNGYETAVGSLNTSERKAAFALVANVEHLAKRHGLEKLGFLTLTFPPSVKDPKEASRRFNNANRRIFGELFPERVVVIEPHKDGRPHFHCLVACPEDIRTGFSWETFKEACEVGRKQGWHSPEAKRLTRAYAQAASPFLRHLWGVLRDSLPRYGFGRYELLPVRSNSEAVSQYVGKYLEKGMPHRLDYWENVRLIRYSRANDWRAVKSQFAWVAGGENFRRVVAEIAEHLDCESEEELRAVAGRYWAFKILAMMNAETQISTRDAARILIQSSCRTLLRK